MKVVLYSVLGIVWAALGVAFVAVNVAQPAPFSPAFWIGEAVLVWLGLPLELAYFVQLTKGKRGA